MEQVSAERSFPFRIGRTLALATGALVAIVLIVGGTSLALAARIHAENEAIAGEYDHILRLGQVHSLFDDLIFELHQMDSTGLRDRAAEALLIVEDLGERIDVLEAERGAEGSGLVARERQALAELRRLSEEGAEMTKRLAAAQKGLAPSDLDWLSRVKHEVPHRTEELAEAHRGRTMELLRSGQDGLRAIVGLYVAFLFIGTGLVFAAGFTANSTIAAPLRRLCQASEEIAEGRLDARVRVASGTEIGRLSQAFNRMADRLQERERELASASGVLQDKVRETQALHRIGTEIARLQQIDRVLQSVVDKARELLQGDAATLCLFSPVTGELSAQATSGGPDAFRADAQAARCQPLPGGCRERTGACPLIAPECARSFLSVPLQLGSDEIGALYVATRREHRWSTGQTELLAGLATQAAVAIERTRLAEEVRSLAAVEERERLAREMHDGLAQTLGLLHLKLQAALARCQASALAGELREMAEIAAGAYEDVRQSIFGLRTFVSRGLGLVATLTEFLHEFSSQNALPVELEARGAPIGSVPASTEVQAIRIIQEALTNVRKHAAASRAIVRLERDGAWLRVSVEDDGRGWDSGDAGRLHFGLQMMRERAEGLGGRLELDTAPGRGTRIVAILPGGAA